MKTAPIIVIEGLDGVGKTTLSTRLAQALGATWLTTPGESLREPATRARFEAAVSASPLARSLAYGATVLDAGARARRLARSGTPVVIDRYWLSTWVYASDEARGLLKGLESHVVVPTLTLFANALEAVRRARLCGRSGTLTAADLDTLTGHRAATLTQLYRGLADNRAAGRFIELDCSGTAEEVLHAAVRLASTGEWAEA